jgi:hypothetical protein
VQSKRLRRLLHARGRLVTYAGEHSEKIPVLHGRTQEGPTQRLVLHLEKLPAVTFRQCPTDGPLQRLQVELRLLLETPVEERADLEVFLDRSRNVLY